MEKRGRREEGQGRRRGGEQDGKRGRRGGDREKKSGIPCTWHNVREEC